MICFDIAHPIVLYTPSLCPVFQLIKSESFLLLVTTEDNATSKAQLVVYLSNHRLLCLTHDTHSAATRDHDYSQLVTDELIV